MQGLEQKRTIHFFLLSALIALSRITKSGYQRGNFSVVLRLSPLCTASKVCGAFRSRVLPSSYGRQSRTMLVYCVISVAPEASLTKYL